MDQVKEVEAKDRDTQTSRRIERSAESEDNRENEKRISVKMTPLSKLRRMMHPFRCFFMFMLFLFTFLSILPFVKYEGDPTKIGDQANPPIKSEGFRDTAQYCKYRLEQLMAQYQDGISHQYLSKPRLLSDNPKGIQAQFLSKYFKIVPFSEGKHGLSAFKASEVFWFEDRRLPLNISAPCSLFFQNSVEGYHQLHLKHELAKLVRSSTDLNDSIMPRTYVLDDENDCVEFFSEIPKISTQDESPRYVLKNEGKGSELSCRCPNNR